MLPRRLFLVALVCLAFAPLPARAQGVDLLLVLCVDASGSIDEDEFRFQREGYAAAIRDPRIVRAMTDGPNRSSAIAFVEWGTPGLPMTAVGWGRIHDQTSADVYAQRVLDAPRSPQSYNALGDAIHHATGLIKNAPFRSERAVIDVSGDGPDNRSLVPAPLARDAAVQAGITVNALAVVKEGSTMAERGERLVASYQRDVIGGPGAFVVVARDYPDFAQAIFNKMIREVAGEPHRPQAAEATR